MTTTHVIPVNVRAVSWCLLTTALILTLLHVIAMLVWYLDLLPLDDWLYISFFDLDEEESIGTWFSTLLLFMAGLLSLLQARFLQGSGDRWGLCWQLLGIGFFILSLDEVAGFHEFVNTIAEETHWTTYGIALALVVGVLFLPFLMALPVRTRMLLLLSGAVYLGGAIGVERATIWHEVNDELDTLAYNLTTALEEFMEMAGVIMYIAIVLSQMTRGGTVQVIEARIGSGQS